MNPSEYRRYVMGLISPPAKARPGVRGAINTKRKLNIFHSIIGLKSETGELMQGLHNYVLGFQMTDAEKLNAREEMGDCFFYIFVLAKELKVKLPGLAKKVKVPQTTTNLLLEFDSEATFLLDHAKKVFYGREMNLDLIKHHVYTAAILAWGLNLKLFGEPPEQVIMENVIKLSARYGTSFDAGSEAKRNPAAEQQAVAQHKAAAETI